MTDAGKSLNKSKYILDNFERAMAEDWIEVYFQPIVRTSSGRVCAEEALVRWDDPVFGMLNPADFIPALESTNEVYKLDLFVLDKTLEKMNEQRKKGLYVVPTSINLSQVDFYSCDIIEEVTSRVEASRIPRRLIAIDISEGSLSIGNDFVMSQIEQFQELGFQIWMDDFGSGDNATALLQCIKFDALKINMYFVKQISTSESARIILTELVRMAMSLGMETIAEGVEYKEQVAFLKEIGCSKMQGFLYCKPISVSDIFLRYENGAAIGFENPKESKYYSAIGRINLYDLSFARGNGAGLDNYFDTFPIAIIEAGNRKLRIIRGNKTFREFMYTNFGNVNVESTYDFDNNDQTVGKYTMTTIRKCGMDGRKQIFDDRLYDGRTVQMLVQRIAVNPVTKVAAVVLVILAVAEKHSSSENLTYNYIARALAEDYFNLYFINMDTDEYVEYSSDAKNRDVSVAEKSHDFFNKIRKDFKRRIYSEDHEMMSEVFSKEQIEKDIKEKGIYSITYRRVVNGKPFYVNLKAVRVRSGENYIIMGISDVDAQMKQREAVERIKEEQISYTRFMALARDYFCVYSVDLETEEYVCFNYSKEYTELNIDIKGNDFFEKSRENAKKVAHPDDLRNFLKHFTRKNVLKMIKENGSYIYKYRFLINGEVIHICLKAALVDELDGTQLIVGIQNIEAQVKMELEYTNTLQDAEDRATKDQLTGVKNKRAYADEEDYLNIQIQAGMDIEFAMVVCDLNGLKQVNDTLGHQAGDAYIKEGCNILCDVFARSPVYRIGGDEFAVVVRGKDYTFLEARLEKINRANARNKKAGKVTLAVGSAKYSKEDKFVSDVFDRADSEMYKNKKKMKAEGNS